MKPRLPEFDVLVDMARNDPQGLEALRRRLTRQVIDRASNDVSRRRLEGLQFQVDAERKKARSPMAACMRISEMMCQSLAELHKSMVAPAECRLAMPKETGNVVLMTRTDMIDVEEDALID
jgi:ribosome biogenesis SPOUT family RNA methylase Rps3